MRAAALRFLAVAMTLSSSQAAGETQAMQSTSCQPAPIDKSQTFSDPGSPDRAGLFAPDTALSGKSPVILTEAALARLDGMPAADSESAHLRSNLQAVAEQGQGFAGPLFLQSDFAARCYTQGIWDFGIEQLLLQGTFWEQLPSLLQVPLTEKLCCCMSCSLP